MSTQPVMVVTNFVGMHVNAANVGVGAKNPDGSFNATGTVLGVSQTAHAAVEFARTGMATGKVLPGVGMFLGAAAMANSYRKIQEFNSSGKSPQQSDIAGLIGGAAAIAGGAALILGGGIIVPIAVGVGVSAGIYQVVAGAKGWTVDDAKGLLFERALTPQERAEVDSIMRGLQDDPAFQQCMREYTGQVPVFNPDGLLPVNPWFDVLVPDFSLIEDIKRQTQVASTIPSPIILDLDGDGVIGTVGLPAGVFFDHAADGFAERSGWVAPGDGLLVWDRNANGVIDSGRELFGSETLLPNGLKAVHGFEALRALDANGDGVIDASDPVFAQLRVWVDASTDARTGQGELLSLEEAGVRGIHVAYSKRSAANEAQWRKVA